MAVVIQVTKDDQVSPLLRRIGAEINAPTVKRVMGRAVVPVVKSNFEKLDGESNNPLGHSGYWRKAAGSVHQPDIQSDGFSIAIGQLGVGLHFHGGTVRPGKNISRHSGKPTQYLTIPARSEAYGHRADEFKNLHFQAGKGLAPALVENDQVATTETIVKTSRNGVKRRVKVAKDYRQSGGIVMFWLVKQVTVQPDPRVLPTTPEMTLPAFQAAVSYLGRIAGRTPEGGTS